MAKLINNTSYKSLDGTSYRIELYDNDSTGFGADTELELSEEGFELQWEGDASNPTPAFLPSSLTFTCFANTAQRNLINAAVWGTAEYNLFVRLYRTNDLDNEKLEWVGVVTPESVSEVIQDGYVEMTLKASDGISLLKEINFVDDSLARYNSEMSAIEWLYECLKKSPVHNYMFVNLAIDMFLEERQLMRPVTDTYTTFPNTDAVLDTMFIHSNSLYARKVTESRTRNGYEQRKPSRNTSFHSTYEVLQNILASFGATLSQGDGRWQVFNRERIVNNGDDASANYFSWYKDGTWLHTAETLETPQDFDADGKKLLKGASRRGVFPVAFAHQKFEKGGSDLIWRSGTGHESLIRLQRGLVQYTQQGGTVVNDVPIFRYLRDEDYLGGRLTGPSTFIDPEDMAVANLAGSILTNPEDGLVEGLQMPISDNGGKFTLHLAGNATFRGNVDGVNQTLAYGTIGLYRMFVEVNDGTYSFRLKRRMRTYPYGTGGADVQFYIDENLSSRYVPKLYDAAEWVRADGVGYATAYLDIMIGADGTVIEQGTTDEWLQSVFTNTTFYTPPQLKVDADNETTLKFDDDGRTHYQWRFLQTVDLPSSAEGATAEFESLKVWNPQIMEIPSDSAYARKRNSSGTTIAVPATETLDYEDFNSWVDTDGTLQDRSITAPNVWDSFTGLRSDSYVNPGEYQPSGWRSNMEIFELSGLEIFVGDGTKEWDIESYVSLDTPVGSEGFESGTTALGANYVNSGSRTAGRWIAAHPSAPANKEDNLRFHLFNETGTLVASMGQAVATSALNVRGQIRELINGTIHVSGAPAGKEWIRPWKMFKSSQWGAGSTEWFVPMRCAVRGDGKGTMEALKGASWIPKPISGSDETTGFSGGGETDHGGIGPFDAGGKDRLLFNQGKAAKDVTDFIDTSGFVGTIALTDIKDKIDFIQTTAPITDDDLGGGGGGKFGDLFPIFIKRF